MVDEAVAVLAFCACAAYPSCFRLLEIVRYVVNVLVIHTMEFLYPIRARVSQAMDASNWRMYEYLPAQLLLHGCLPSASDVKRGASFLSGRRPMRIRTYVPRYRL